jgi:hypothetical protein
MCGGQIVANRWEADHVLRHAFGGGNGPDNFLAIDWLCNSYRLDYSPKEMQWILKIGVWARTQMAKSNSECGREMAKLFFDKELRRERRNELRRENRKKANGPK